MLLPGFADDGEAVLGTSGGETTFAPHSVAVIALDEPAPAER
ncbi:hypothetical protein [Compostimonas suwonensis]|uniref:Uncharacterized protein n=1 Tax=Compostimonas suwonensis TaxID=1048394 RepID=A0A2M9BZA9_9MICO|nr:hypothetical protein [Compostimonas suwonensis]PJJ63419.1 hypothetical protein CLV54_1084 [Compostimonas suwonensis]